MASRPCLARSLALAAVASCLLALGCGPKPGVKRAQSLLDAGDYRGAKAAADEELVRTPESAELWRIKIRAELLVGDSDAAVAVYGAWHARLGDDDKLALREMAELTLWRGLITPSADLNMAAIKAIERHQLVRLADEVTALIAADDDVVAATAAIAVLRDHPQAASVAAARLSSPDPRARAAVIAGIARKIPERAGKEIREALSDPAPEVRRAAIAAIVLLRDRADTAALAKLARTDPDETVRARAARALAKAPYFPDVELARVLLSDAFVGARLAALELAHSRAATGGRDILRDAARADELPLAIRAAVLLGKGPAWKELFARALASQRWPVRAAALGAILAATDRDTAIAAARASALDPHRGVRLAAARLHFRLGDRAAARPIFEAEIAGDAADLGAAVTLVRDYQDTRGRAAIAAAAASDDRARRAAAIGAFAQLGAGPVDPSLVAALADKAPALRMQAADVILELIEE